MVILTFILCLFLHIMSIHGLMRSALRRPLRRGFLVSDSVNFIPTVSSSATRPRPIADNVLIGLNGAQDMMIRVSSVRGLVQEFINRLKLSDIAAQSLGTLFTFFCVLHCCTLLTKYCSWHYIGELAACTVMMGSSMKGGETLQVLFYHLTPNYRFPHPLHLMYLILTIG